MRGDRLPDCILGPDSLGYRVLERPLLEYATCVWSPYLKKDIHKLESVQRRATKLVKDICHQSYEDRLHHLGLPTLEYGRDRNDMIQVYKAINGIDDIDWMKLFSLAPSNSTRGHSLKLFKKQCRTTHRLHTFSSRIVDQWNSLSNSTVTAKSVNAFKSSLTLSVPKRHICRLGVERQSDVFVV